jgi:hypothetical protein
MLVSSFSSTSLPPLGKPLCSTPFSCHNLLPHHDAKSMNLPDYKPPNGEPKVYLFSAEVDYLSKRKLTNMVASLSQQKCLDEVLQRESLKSCS